MGIGGVMDGEEVEDSEEAREVVVVGMEGETITRGQGVVLLRRRRRLRGSSRTSHWDL